MIVALSDLYHSRRASCPLSIWHTVLQPIYLASPPLCFGAVYG
jgi:hypothetical protein